MLKIWKILREEGASSKAICTHIICILIIIVYNLPNELHAGGSLGHEPGAPK